MNVFIAKPINRPLIMCETLRNYVIMMSYLCHKYLTMQNTYIKIML